MECMKIELRNCNKEVVGVALVSPEDYDNVNKYSWSMWNDGGPSYAQGDVDGKTIRMHQLIMGPPPKDGLVIDHKNNNGLDNQRNNLRFSTRSGNAQNKQKKKGTSSIYIGVIKNKKNKFIVAQGGVELGRFDDEVEAAKHYDKYVTIKYDGICITNFDVLPEDVEGLTLDDLILTQKKLRTLPDNIVYNKKDNKYTARKSYQGITYSSGYVATLEIAIEELKTIDAKIKEIYDKFVKEHYEKPIERNEDNHAVIIIRNKNNEKVNECIVDDKYWHELTLFNWHMTNGYTKTKMQRIDVTMHQFLMKKTHTDIDLIDHINNNRLDNRMSNLRSVNAATNAHNKAKKEGCLSKYTGVTREDSKWLANITVNYTVERLGRFETEIEAAQAYNKRASEVYKENARLNKFD